MSTPGQGMPTEVTHSPDEDVADTPIRGSEEVSGLLRQMPVLRWVLVFCGVLGVSLAACLLMQPRAAATSGAPSSNRCVCR